METYTPRLGKSTRLPSPTYAERHLARRYGLSPGRAHLVAGLVGLPTSGGLRPVGPIAGRVVAETGSRAVAYWLDKATATTGREAQQALAEANAIRERMGTTWAGLLDERRAAA